MPSTYAPLYFASQVLIDGRVLVEGGEYNFLNQDETNLGAIYDPVKNKWTTSILLAAGPHRRFAERHPTQ